MTSAPSGIVQASNGWRHQICPVMSLLCLIKVWNRDESLTLAFISFPETVIQKQSRRKIVLSRANMYFLESGMQWQTSLHSRGHPSPLHQQLASEKWHHYWHHQLGLWALQLPPCPREHVLGQAWHLSLFLSAGGWRSSWDNLRLLKASNSWTQPKSNVFPGPESSSCLFAPIPTSL